MKYYEAFVCCVRLTEAQLESVLRGRNYKLPFVLYNVGCSPQTSKEMHCTLTH